MKTSQIDTSVLRYLTLGWCIIFLVFSGICRSEIIDEDVLTPPSKGTVQSPTPIQGNSDQKKQPSEEKKSSEEKKLGKPEEEKKIKPSPSKSTPPKPASSPAQEKAPVHFTSQGLKGLREKGLVELVKDVLVTQGELKIEADNAQVFFSEESKEVQKIIALGQPVKMSNIDPNTGEKLEAFGNQIVFNNLERVVHLEGNARIKKGTNSTIKGKKITYELDSGWIKADKVAGEITPQK